MLRQSQDMIFSIAKWPDFIAMDFDPSLGNFFPKTRCLGEQKLSMVKT